MGVNNLLTSVEVAGGELDEPEPFGVERKCQHRIAEPWQPVTTVLGQRRLHRPDARYI